MAFEEVVVVGVVEEGRRAQFVGQRQALLLQEQLLLLFILHFGALEVNPTF